MNKESRSARVWAAAWENKEMYDTDIRRCATALIDSYGDDATIHAAMRVDEILADGAGTWRR